VNLLTPGEARGQPYELAVATRLARKVTKVLRGGGGRRDATDDEAAELGAIAALPRGERR
jgi:hypothetical protein